MLIFQTKINKGSPDSQNIKSSECVYLPFEIRQKARFVAITESGVEVGIQVKRGHILRDGDKLQAEDGTVLEVKAGEEPVSTVKESDEKLLARLCYHLGNRHVQLQVEKGWCRFLQDHVLDEMVELLGATVIHENAPFEPEAGAYAGGHHHGDHAHQATIHRHDDSNRKAKNLNDIQRFSVS